MVIEYVLFIFGIYLLIKSSDFIVGASSTLAKKLGISTLVIGLTVVAFGTSLPELVLNIFARSRGSSEIVFGNIIGSNIANILFVLGITSIVGVVKLKSSTIWREIPFALLSVFVLFLLISDALFKPGDYYIGIKEGLLFLSFFAIFLYYIYHHAQKDRSKVVLSREVKENYNKIYLRLAVGLLGIYFGAKWVIDGAIFISAQLGFSEFLISATILAIGTSLPELVVSVVAVWKKNVDLAIGNIIGSNIFNILWVLGIIPLFGKLLIPPFIFVDIAILFIATLVLFIFIFIGKKHEIGFREGLVFILMYILYLGFLIVRG
ncbi:MAG: calcium/sodium antiporter [Nanoarchaeota archaeon]|nr:calcium/sodium antiporter [Nanoarchaeota archaeon]